MARDEHRAPLGGEAAQQRAQIDARLRVEARRRLVQQQHVRVVHERAGQAEPLLLPAREHPRGRIGEVGQPDLREQSDGARRMRLVGGIPYSRP